MSNIIAAAEITNADAISRIRVSFWKFKFSKKYVKEQNLLVLPEMIDRMGIANAN
jgi:hypothetical protein